MKCVQYTTLTTKVKSLIKFRTIYMHNNLQQNIWNYT